MIRWKIEDVAQTLDIDPPGGLVELWDAVPAGYAPTAASMAAARVASQNAIAQGLALIEQKVALAAGVSVGYRPEIFDKIKGLPGFDTVAETANLAIAGNLNLATLSEAGKDLLVEIIQDVGARWGAQFTQVQWSEAGAQVVAIVWDTIQTIVQAERQWKEYKEAQAKEALDCVPPAYSAKLDLAESESGVQLLTGPDWRDLFFPEVRPYDENFTPWPESANVPESGWLDKGWRGFTCCISTIDAGRVIAPVGSGVGNRVQVGFPPVYYGKDNRPGFGLLPMLKDYPIHRAIIVPGQGRSHLTYDPSQVLATLAGLGNRVWRILWGRGPATYAVPGAEIAAAWDEYFRGMRHFIRFNEYGIGGFADYGDRRVCDKWDVDGRTRALRWIFEKIKMPDPERQATSDGIVDFSESAPVKAWKAFAEYQKKMLGRVGVLLVDADKCVPEWRAAIIEAQKEALGHPTAPCEVLPENVPNQELRQQLISVRSGKGAWCIAAGQGRIAAYSEVSATSGPSMIPLSDESEPLPEMPSGETPSPPRPGPPALGSASAQPGGAGVAVAGLIVLVTLGIAWAASQGKR